MYTSSVTLTTTDDEFGCVIPQEDIRLPPLCVQTRHKLDFNRAVIHKSTDLSPLHDHGEVWHTDYSTVDYIITVITYHVFFFHVCIKFCTGRISLVMVE